MKCQIVIRRTITGWYNLYDKGVLVANVPLQVIKELIPGFNVHSMLACYELDMSLIKYKSSPTKTNLVDV